MVSEETLTQLIDDFGAKKSQFDELKKNVDRLNKDIKAQVASKTDDKKFVYETDKYKLNYSTSSRVSINEDGLIEYLKNSGLDIKGLIKSKEYVDYDILEASIYNEKIPADIIKGMSQFNSVNEVVSIKVTPIKGGI